MFPLELALKFCRFLLVGCTGASMDFGLTYLLKEKAKLQKLIANAFGFVLGSTTTYILNRLYTFHNSNPEIVTQYFKFIFICFISLSLNTLIIYFLTEKRKLNFYISKLAAALIVVSWNFFANNYYTFKI